MLNIAEWSSSVARRAHNPKVIGSNPIPATKNIEKQLFSENGEQLFFFAFHRKRNQSFGILREAEAVVYLG